jgi:hypothetical protein
MTLPIRWNEYSKMGRHGSEYQNIEIFFSTSFSNEQRKIIVDALYVLSHNLLKKSVLDCTYNKANRNFALDKFESREPPSSYKSDRDLLTALLGSVLIKDGYDLVKDKNGGGQIYIGSSNRGYKRGESFTAGSAPLYYLSTGSRVPTSDAPNTYDYKFWDANRENKNLFFQAYDVWQKDHPSSVHAYIKLNSDAIGKNLAYEKNEPDTQKLAGVIAHELLHNLGWDHTNNNLSSYSGTVIEEFGRCVAEERVDGRPVSLGP